jgi:menaquinone-dependent protoporphyrinogen oxidase
MADRLPTAMARVLIVFGTTEGHTGKIASTAADWISAKGHEVVRLDSATMPGDLDLEQFQMFLLAGSLHEEHHQKALTEFASANADSLQRSPGLFLSVSLAAALRDGPHQAAAHRYIGKFIQETGWLPTESLSVAGALPYTRYDLVQRLFMKFIAMQEGGDTDTTRDYEYTDWSALRSSIERFVDAHLCVGGVPLESRLGTSSSA